MNSKFDKPSIPNPSNNYNNGASAANTTTNQIREQHGLKYNNFINLTPNQNGAIETDDKKNSNIPRHLNN